MPGNIVGLQGVHGNSLRSPLAALCMSYVLIVLLQTASERGLARVTANPTLFNHVMSVAQALYRCYLTCQDAFPPPDMKADWLDHVWCEACRRTGVNPRSLASPRVEEASLIFCRMLLLFTRILSSLLAASRSSQT